MGWSQDCRFSFKGLITDIGSGKALSEVHIYAQELEKEAISDSSGIFQFDSVCPGNYHIFLSHIGCEAQEVFVRLGGDTFVYVFMDHSFHISAGTKVKGTSGEGLIQAHTGLNELEIAENASQNLGNLLESLAGVSTLKNGSGISKPVVHGLYGNRITILNNGVAQSGQQWGNDHSPEIDPLVANTITVIKGVSALEFMGANLGSVILVEPKKIKRDPHLHGKASYFFESNGLSNGINLQLQKANKAFAWRINGTVKKSGDKRTPSYFLTNTGNQEINGALQLEKVFSNRWFADLYISSFNTELGVLRGSHIGNVSDLEAALVRDRPFFTENKFSYAINAPKQKVNHQLLKLHNKVYLGDSQWFDLVYAFQLNNRKEFDVRRSGRTEIPALNLEQYTHFFELKYHQDFKKNLILNAGVQSNYTHNVNNPETGILPLIPDYISFENGVFSVLQKSLDKSVLELGFRYDQVIQNVVAISQTLPRTLLRYSNHFNNWGASFGWNYQLLKSFNVEYGLGFATRNPAINELYSGGLHQGVSGIELGNSKLQTEQSVKSTLGINGVIREKWSLEALGYFQNIDNYIYLQPQNQFNLTIRGAFPVFAYEQTNAIIYGGDFSVHYQISKPWSAKLRYSYLRGEDVSNKLPLIYMPANNMNGEVVFEVPGHIKIGNRVLENTRIGVETKYVFRQNNLLAGQDFLASPAAYNLIGISAATNVQWRKTRLHLFVKADNLLNTVYRDYLNRQRYFANDLGINIRFGSSLKF